MEKKLQVVKNEYKIVVDLLEKKRKAESYSTALVTKMKRSSVKHRDKFTFFTFLASKLSSCYKPT